MPELATELLPEDDDAVLEQAEGVARDYCGWHIAPSRAGEYTLDEASSVIILPTMRLTAVSAIVDADGNDLAAYGFTFTPAGVVRRGSPTQAGVSYLGAWWPAGTVVTFTHGYAEVPPAVTRAVQGIASQLPSNLKSKTAGPFGETYFDDIAPGDRSRLDKYRLPSRP